MPQKTIIVTGGAGFVGSHLCERLVAQGHRVISLDNYFTGSKDNHIEGVEYREGHTKDIARLIPEKPDLIYHLGEYSRVEQSLLEPELVRDLNIVGTQGVIDFWRAKKCKLVYAGSSTKFGDEGLARHATPYAESKAANSELVRHVGDEETLPYAVTYFYNVYGPRERAGIYGTVVESFRQMYLRGVPFTVTAPGTQERNFTHVHDIIDGLVSVGEQGSGDDFGLGNERPYTIIEVAKFFGGPVILLPERAGNRMRSRLDTTKARALGWQASRSLEAYVTDFVKENPRGPVHAKRVLVLSTTFYPHVGPAEEALIELMRRVPDLKFDVIAAAFSKDSAQAPVPNANVYRVGFGNRFDKYLLPWLGYRVARRLHRQYDYLFAWSLMASYAALAGVLLRRALKLPLLITLANQNLSALSAPARVLLPLILSDADQVYGAGGAYEGSQRRFMGDGDAFANQLRYAYTEILRLSYEKGTHI